MLRRTGANRSTSSQIPIVDARGRVFRLRAKLTESATTTTRAWRVFNGTVSVVTAPTTDDQSLTVHTNGGKAWTSTNSTRWPRAA